MKAKDYLQQVKKLDKMIQNKIIEKEQWMTMATSITSSSDGERVQSSGSQQKMADAVAKYIDIEKEIDRYIDKLVDSKQEIIKTIESLPVIEYDILHKVYIGIVDNDGMIKYLTLEEVGAIYKKTYTWAATVHGRALKHVQDVLDGKKI